MIPALLAIPVVQGVVGGVIGGVMNAFASSTPTAPSTGSTAFNPYLSRATAAPQAPSTTAASGTMHASDWNQMDAKGVQSWATSLTGRHVDATDDAGRTISGIVGGLQLTGHTLSLNIGGHLVSLSQLKQVSWSSPAV